MQSSLTAAVISETSSSRPGEEGGRAIPPPPAALLAPPAAAEYIAQGPTDGSDDQQGQPEKEGVSPPRRLPHGHNDARAPGQQRDQFFETRILDAVVLDDR